MMLAMGFEANVPESDDLVISVCLGKGALQQRDWVLAVATEEFPVGAHDAIRSAEQPFTGRVIAGPADQRANRLHRFLATRPLLGHGRPGALIGQRHGRSKGARHQWSLS